MNNEPLYKRIAHDFDLLEAEEAAKPKTNPPKTFGHSWVEVDFETYSDYALAVKHYASEPHKDYMLLKVSNWVDDRQVGDVPVALVWYEPTGKWSSFIRHYYLIKPEEVDQPCPF